MNRSLSSRLSSLALTLALCGLGSALHAQDLSGYWDMRTPNPSNDGTFRDTFFHIEQKGDTISGELIRRPNGIPISGTFKDGALHFVTVPPPPPSPQPGQPPRRQMPVLTYDGKFEGGKLMLISQGRMGEVHSVAEKVTKEATEPPAALPLPALRDLPENGLARTPPMGWNSWNKFAGRVDDVAEKVTKEATEPPAALPLPALRDLPENGLARTPPMGWNSWNKFAGRVDDASVRGMADAMVSSGMRDAGYVYINIDDTWELNRDANGNIVPNKKFPDMKALADYVHSKGLKIGIYSSPGPKTCAGYEGSYGHVAQDARTYAAWGIDYLKYDLCSDREIYKDDAPTLQAIYQDMGQALEATHRPIVYSLCEYGVAQPWTGWGEKTSGNLWRTTDDISDHWASMDKIGFSQIKIASFAKPGHWNDPDMLEIGNGGMTADEYRTHMSLWSLLAAPLIAGNDLRSMTDETKSILMNRDVIAIDQDRDYKPVVSVSSNNGLEVLMRPLSDGSVAVGLFNRTASPAQISFAKASLPANLAGKKLDLRDLWKNGPVRMNGDNFTATVPTHGVVLVKLSAR